MTEVKLANEDGQPHLAYFDESFFISFVWSGIWDDPIQVCPGVYGAPVTDQIDVSYAAAEHFMHATPPHFWTGWFAGVCKDWIITNFGAPSDDDLHQLIERARREGD